MGGECSVQFQFLLLGRWHFFWKAGHCFSFCVASDVKPGNGWIFTTGSRAKEMGDEHPKPHVAILYLIIPYCTKCIVYVLSTMLYLTLIASPRLARRHNTPTVHRRQHTLSRCSSMDSIQKTPSSLQGWMTSIWRPWALRKVRSDLIWPSCKVIHNSVALV